MITEFQAKDYGPLKDVTVALTPLHAFIGPNDSGKSTLLRALVTAINGYSRLPRYLPASVWNLIVRLASGAGFVRAAGNGNNLRFAPHSAEMIWLSKGAHVARFDADALRAQSELMSEDQALTFVDARGAGLPAVMDVLNNRNDDSLRMISDGMTRLFPSLARIQLRNVNNRQKQVAAQLIDGRQVTAEWMSEGMLFYLAYASIKALGGAALIAVEEPETGLHPSRIAEVIRILRDVSESGTQVVIATHSPLVVNELKPEEVSLVTRSNDAGTKVTPISQTPDFEKRSSVYALGELWLSYANAIDEAPLLDGKASEPAP